MLPNLFGLSLHTLPIGTEKRDAGQLDAASQPASKIPKGQEILEVGWENLINDSTRTAVRFQIRATVGTNPDWTATFTIVDRKIYMTTGDDEIVPDGSNCVEIDMGRDQMSLESLFHSLDDDVIGKCEIYPAITGGGGGAGNFVLEMCDGIATVLGHSIHLDDVSSYPDSIKPKVSTVRMTHFLAMKRGYGYYEARGYFAEAAIDFYELWLNDKDNALQTELGRVQIIDLLWTHTIFTTPVNELVEAIRAFPNTMAAATLGPVPMFHQTNYTKEWADAHADAAQKEVRDLLLWLNHHDGSMSVRNILSLANGEGIDVGGDESKLEEVLETLLNQVWTRRFKKNSRGYPIQYPGRLLRKYINPKTNMFLTCMPDHEQPSGPPKISLRPVRRDMLVTVL